MPLSKAKQRRWMQEYRQRKRGVIPSVIPKLANVVIPNRVIKPIPGLVIQGNRIVSIKRKERPSLPLYDPTKHKAGDRVLVQSPYSKRLIETTIPELDADGHPM